jgi:hypothetical protein
MTMRTTKKKEVHPGTLALSLTAVAAAGLRRGGSRAMSTRKATATKKRRFNPPLRFAITVLTVGLLGTAHAQAQTVTKTRQQNNDFSTTLTNTCPQSNDTVTVNGHSTFQFQTQETPGAFHLKIQVHEQGNGVSAYTGIKYQYQLLNSTFAFDSSTPTFSTTTSTKNHLIGNGTQNDNFFLTTFEKIVVNRGQAAVTIDRFRTDCK